MAQEISRYSSAALAFLGDSVFELNVRARIVMDSRGNAGTLNNMAKAYTSARSQARMSELIKDILTEEELSVYKRGRNYKAPSVPRSCTPSEYRKATGLEALFGYLYILGRQDRIDELIGECIRITPVIS